MRGWIFTARSLSKACAVDARASARGFLASQAGVMVKSAHFRPRPNAGVPLADQRARRRPAVLTLDATRARGALVPEHVIARAQLAGRVDDPGEARQGRVVELVNAEGALPPERRSLPL
jgi:hypothetical protein